MKRKSNPLDTLLTLEETAAYVCTKLKEKNIEFPTGPVSLGNDLTKEFAELKTHVGTLTLLTPTDCIKDRLCALVYHDGEECWVKVINGEFKETIYKEDDKGELNILKTSISKPNEVTYMKDFMGFHRLENVSNKRSMSLHLYAKPIRKCRIFDEKSKAFVNKDLGYDTIA